MKNKVIDFSERKNIIQNTGVKYAELLEQFLEPFINEFTEFDDQEDIIEFGINAWNFGNMKLILPEGAIDAQINSINEDYIDANLLKRMIELKITKFKEYTNFIAEFELKETSGDPILSVLTQEQDAYLAAMMDDDLNESFDDEFDAEFDEEYDENYINRTAITLKPLQPFMDWCNNLFPGEENRMEDTNTYLISEDIDDVEAWLKKKFDKLFMMELEAWNTNKKTWPIKRNFKMFKEWFQINISTMVYDFEKEPISKSE